MSATSVRRRLAALAPRLAVTSPPPTTDVLQGTERLLVASARADLRAEYASLLAAPGGHDAVVTTTGTNTSVAFLSRCGLFEDMGRNNDVSYYVVGRGKRGKTKEGHDFAWETSQSGYRHCIPRSMVSEGEKVAFAGLLQRLACDELAAAATEMIPAGEDAARPLTGASVHLDADIRPHTTTLAACLEGQLRGAAAGGPVDCVLVHGADTAERVAMLREVLAKNERRLVRQRVPGLTGIYAEEEGETEVGFDLPAVVLREGQVHEII